MISRDILYQLSDISCWDVEFDNEEDDEEVVVALLEQDFKFVLTYPKQNTLSTSDLFLVFYIGEIQTAFIDLLDKTVGTDSIELVDAFSFNISILDYDDDDEQQYCVYYYGYDDLSTITDILNSGAVKQNLFGIPVASDTTIG
ncbi:MAG: hypothetical protein EZS28_030300 [Streblomastix strix]|uniref:Uncharacterized protein n=1 Tax=Streblomastix strix TaxID=222440 RepID=A0A5J4UVN4_9EUKA|nr:MAG: hypothetical protein EZS28_030300 [Streblomastix strix]